jgi:hypothetical protein
LARHECEDAHIAVIGRLDADLVAQQKVRYQNTGRIIDLELKNAALTERLRVAEERIATVRGLHTHLNGCSGKSAEIVHGEIVIAPGECAHYECEQGCDGIRRHGDLCPTMRVLAPTNDAAPKEAT